jgi:hypothetical protein
MTCPYCKLYAAQSLPCAVCAATGKPKRKPSKPKATARKRHSLETRLQQAGLTSDDAIRDAIPTGALTAALYGATQGTTDAVLRDYMALVERVAGDNENVLKYRNRLVSGVAA